MKNKRLLCGIILATTMTTPATQAGVPEPSFRFYGQVRNEFGWPVTSDDALTLELQVGDALIDRASISERSGTGVNFVLEAPCDAGTDSARYADFAVRSGDVVAVHALDGTNVVPVMHVDAIPAVGIAGDAIRVDIQLGTDSDNDGLSDRWENIIINNDANDDIRTLADVSATDDYDGDGVSNADEFFSGTSPVFEGDVFELLDFMKTADGSPALCFATVVGFTYQITATTAPGSDEWIPVSFRLTPDGTTMQSYTETQSASRYFYVEFDQPMSLFRLEQM